MEHISKQQIAKLVLGYLKEEKCKKAFRYLLESSPYLRNYLRKVKRKRHFSTRVSGLSLVDIINEYSTVYRIVQERLESTNYFKHSLGYSSLEEQLLYLLNRVQYSPPSSPCSFASRSSSGKDYSFFDNSANNLNNSSSIAQNKHTTTDNTVNDNDKVISTDVFTTSPNSLPGNSSTESVLKPHKSKVDDLDLSIEVLSQKLLQNREFQEKLAENINKEVTEEKHNSLNHELDNIIKTVVQRTEQDPIFDKLLSDILGTVETKNTVDSSHNEDEKLQKATSSNTPPNNCTVSTDKTPKSSENFFSLTDYPNLTVTDLPEPNPPESGPDKPPESLCPNPPSTNLQTPQIISSSNQTSCSSSNTDCVTASSVPLMVTSDPPPLVVSNCHNKGLVNTTGLIMNVPSNNMLDVTKSYYVFGSQQLLSITNPQPLPKLTSFNDQDIMSMPTVFVCDNQPIGNSQMSLIPPLITSDVTTSTQIIHNDPSTSINKKDTVKNHSMPSLTDTPSASKKSTAPKKLKTLMPRRSFKTTDPPKILQNLVITTTTTTTTFKEAEPLSEEPIHATPVIENNSIKKTTPKSSSHVRQLDFSTPEKLFPLSKCKETVKTDLAAAETKKDLEEKSAFAVSNKPEETSVKSKSWDSDLRAITGVQVAENKPPTKDNKNTKKRKKVIETSKNNDKEKGAKSKKKKKSANNTNTNKTVSPTNSKAEETTPADTANDQNTTSNIGKELPEVKSKSIEEDSESIFGIDCAVINREIKPTYRKKCNTDNSKKPSVNVEKVIHPLVTPSLKTSLDLIDDFSPTLVLSPTKLNANKRSILEIENKNDNTLKTPEELQLCKNLPVSAAKRNITPSLETPLKKNPAVPKTPQFLSPVNTSDTPFTKVLKEQLQGLDLTSFPTPKFPLTPNLAITPCHEDQSPYARRSTDYSTCSSYYQPSDTEPSKSIEQLLIEEGLRLEGKSVVKSPVKDKTETVEVITQISQTTINERIKTFNSALTGKKNLNLMKNCLQEESYSSQSSSSDSSSSNTSLDDSNVGWNESPTNDTVIHKKMPYSLRSRGTVSEVKETKTPEKVEVEKPPAKVSKIDPKKSILLQALEEKRLGVVAKLKEDELKDHEKQTQKNQNKGGATKTIPKKAVQRNVNRRKNTDANQKGKIASKIDANEKNENVIENEKFQNKVELKKPNQISDKEPAISTKVVEKEEPKKTTELSLPKIQEVLSKEVNKNVKPKKPSKTNTTNKSTVKKVEHLKKVEQKISRFSPVDEIVLHLSSDDSFCLEEDTVPKKIQERICTPTEIPSKLLEPFELVQTQLVECSSEGETCKMKSVNKDTLKEVKDSSHDAEMLVKELKERGIHLVPANKQQRKLEKTESSSVSQKSEPLEKEVNKPDAKKQVSLEDGKSLAMTDSKDNLDKSLEEGEILSETEGSNKNKEKRKKQDLNLQKSKKSTSEKGETKSRSRSSKRDDKNNDRDEIKAKPTSTRNEKKTKSSSNDKKHSDDRKTSLDDRKTSSDDKKSSSDDKKPSDDRKTSSDDRKTSSDNKKTSTDDKKPSDNRRTSSDDRKTSSDNKKSSSDDKKPSDDRKTSSDDRKTSSDNKKTSLDDKKTKSNDKISHESKRSVDTSCVRSKNDEKCVRTVKTDDSHSDSTNSKQFIPETNSKSIVEQKNEKTNVEVSTNSEVQTNLIMFDTKTFHTETEHIIYCEPQQVTESKNYDLKVLQKKISANVYMEEIDAEVEKEMSFTPFKIVLDIPSTLSAVVPKKKSKNEVSKESPLEKLYDKLVTNSSKDLTVLHPYKPSPLADLYSPVKKGSYNNAEQAKVPKNTVKNRSNLLKDNSDRKTCQETKRNADENQRKIQNKNKKDGERFESKTVENNQDKDTNKKQNDEKIEETNKCLSSKVDQKLISSPIDPTDDLMDFAIVGSDRIENDDEDGGSGGRKRKANTNIDDLLEGKKSKTDNCQELLKKIDVDSFLKKLHGNG